MYEDTVANAILKMKPIVLLAYAPVLELHHQIMSMPGGNGGRLESERDNKFAECGGVGGWGDIPCWRRRLRRRGYCRWRLTYPASRKQ